MDLTYVGLDLRGSHHPVGSWGCVNTFLPWKLLDAAKGKLSGPLLSSQYFGKSWDNGKSNGNYYSILRAYRDDGKENGSYHSIMGCE